MTLLHLAKTSSQVTDHGTSVIDQRDKTGRMRAIIAIIATIIVSHHAKSYLTPQICMPVKFTVALSYCLSRRWRDELSLIDDKAQLTKFNTEFAREPKECVDRF